MSAKAHGPLSPPDPALSGVDLNGKTFAVTGGCGFLGRTAVKALAARGAAVRALDIRVDERIFDEDVRSGAKIETIRVDICDAEQLCVRVVAVLHP